MAQVFGLSELGFKSKEFSTIKNELEDALRAEVDPTLSFSANSVAGSITGIVAHQACQVWESLSGLYHSLQPSSATGAALDALCSLTGTYRKPASMSRATAVVTLEPKSKVPKNTRLQSINRDFFKTQTEVSNTSTIRADIEIDLITEEAGPLVAHSGTIATIMTPVAGFSKAIFKETYALGRFIETDEELRIRRFVELKASGASTAHALYSCLKQIDQVEAVYIKENSRSFEAIVKGGNDQDIAKTIWQCKPLGVETVGTIECPVTDSLGFPRKIRFSRPLEIPLMLRGNIKVRRRLEETELNKLKTALVDCGKKYFSLGSEVYASRFYASMLNEPLILDIMTLQLRERSTGKAPSEIKPEQIASLAFNDIAIEQIVEAAS